MQNRPKNISLLPSLILLGLLFFISSCSDLKNAMHPSRPSNVAYVFSNKIEVVDADNKIIKQKLENDLSEYWDDSLKAIHVRQFGIFNTLKDPKVFNAERIPRAVNYMSNFLASQGYHRVIITPNVKIDSINDDIRAHVSMKIQLNKKTIIDTIIYALQDKKLAALAIANSEKSYLKKGDAYTVGNIDNELDRLVAIFRNNGYYNFTKEKIFCEVDTLDEHLMQLSLDPLLQANQIINNESKDASSPHWKLSFQLRNIQPSIVTSFPIGNQVFYSNVSINDNLDSIVYKTFQNKEVKEQVTHIFNEPKFKTSLFQEQIFLKKGEPFNESKYYKTLNTLSSLGAWQQVDGRTSIENDSIFLHYLLTPNLRRSVNFDIEGSKNSGQLLSGNLLGLSTSLTYKDRNVQRKAISSLTSIRTGIELNLNNNKDPLTQTLLWNVGHTYVFPNIIIPFSSIHQYQNFNTKSTFSMNGSSMRRLDYYDLKSVTSAWGYEWKKSKNNAEHLFIYKPLNIELYQLTKYNKLDTLLKLNPFLRSSFNDGNVISQAFTYLYTGKSLLHPNQNNFFKIGIEDAGGFSILFPDIKKHVYTFIKAEVELRKTIQLQNTEWAFRLMGGWGNNYSNNSTIAGQLPFFKQFSAGGPYSMRAWGLRQLGLGSSSFYDTSKNSVNFDRFGDLQLEANAEYRFNLFQLGSYKIGSALFMDMGNVWNIRDAKDNPNSIFKLKNIGQDLAIGVGSGLRFDFDYFIIRIDYGLKLKDPTRLTNGGWLDPSNFKWTEVKPNGTRVNNYAFQFGIGLPF
jgi:hypothetical protein